MPICVHSEDSDATAPSRFWFGSSKVETLHGGLGVGEASAMWEKKRFAAIGSIEESFIVDSVDDLASSRPNKAAQGLL